MKKLKLFFACLLMAVLSIGQVWAVDYQLVYTLDGSVTSGGNSNYAQDGGGLTQDGIDWSVTGNTTINPWRIGGKNLSGVDRKAYSKTAIADNIAKIEIEHGTATLTVNSITIEVASDAEFSNIISTFNESYSSNVTITALRPEGKDWTGRYYRITYNVTAGSSNSYVQLKSVKFYKEKAASDPSLEADPLEVDFGTVELGASVPSETVEVTFANLTGDVTYTGLTTPFSASGTISSTGDAITISADASAAGNYEQTLTIESADDSKSVEVTVKMKVSAPTGTFELFEGDFEEGDYVIYYNGKALKNTISSNRFGYLEVSPAEDKITNPDESIIWHIAASGEYWTLYNTAVEKYAGGTNSKNQGALLADASTNMALWTVTGSATYEFENYGRSLASSDSGNKWLRNNGTSGFACYGSGTGGALTLYKKSDGKQNAGLAYAEADQKQLAKLGEAFTAPTLINPNQLTVTYASNNTAVAEVASNGAITINGVGVAVITASFGGDASYRSGSASYTLGVTTHAGTEADPYVAADVKIAIDVKGIVENAYASGIVSNVVTTTLPAEGYISFYFSADGLTSGQQVEAYKCYGLNSAPFEAVGDVVTGATVVVTGNLKKFNSTYEFDQNCHLVSYEAPATPKQSIANTKETAYSVAQAIAFAADPVTYDLDDFVYVQGVVDYAESFSSTNGTLNIFIKDANAENQFELYKCAGINDGNATTPFEALTDVQEGDEVIGYGQMMYYQQSSIYEFKQGNYLVDLDRPAVAVESVELASSATVKVGKTINLSASVLPANATNKAIAWTVESGNAYINFDNGAVTGVAEGAAVVRATSDADNTKFAECTITIAAADPTYLYYNYEKVTATSGIEDGEYLIVYEGEDGALAFNGGLETLDAVENTIAVTIEDNRIESNATTDAAAFTIDVTNGTLLAASGKYIGVTTYSNGLTSSDEPIAHSSISIAEESANIVVTTTGGDMTLRYNKASNQLRFRYYKSGQEAIQLYKKVGTNEPPKANPQLAWDPADDIELTVGDAFTAPSLTYAQGFDGADDVVIASDNESVAIINNSGEVELVADATGEATITATFAGNDNYKAASASFKITVNAAPVVITDYYEKVTSGDVAEGTYLIVYEAGNVAFNGGLETLDASSNTIVVEITNDNKIGVTPATAAATFYIDPTAGTIRAANGKYIGVTSNSNGLKTSDNADAYSHNFSIDGDGNAVIAPNFEGSTMTLRYNAGTGQERFRYYGSGQQAIQLYKLANEVIKPEAGLAWDPAEDITLIVGDAFTAPTLLNPNNIDAAEITIASSNEAVATINNSGEVELVADAIGWTIISATFAGNDDFKPATVSYKITVNPANSIYVSSLKVNFGSVAKDATIENQKVTVTLTNVAAATATLSGSGASAFSIDKAALTESGDITISASSATAGEFSATLTISDDAGLATAKEVKLSLTVVDGEAEETPISTSSKWVPATEIADGMQVLITGVKDAVVYAMGEQKNTNRAAYVATVDGEGVLTPGEGTMAFTLVAQGDGTYAIKTSNNKYLYAAGSGANHLKTQDEVDVNAKWTLTVASAVAEGSSNRNIMRFNGGSTKLFSCYSSGQEDIKFYVPKPVTPPTPVYETVREGLTAGNYYTICYPKAMTDVQGATLWSFVGKDAQYAYLVQETASTIEAGKPYIMYATASTVQAVLGDETNAPGANGAIHGTFSDLVQEQLDGLATAAGSDLYLVIGNELHRATGAGTGSNTLPAQRAFVVLGDIPAAPANMPAHVRRMPMQTDQTQGFENIEASDKPMKLMIDGQMYILRGEKVYDATGRLVK